MRAQIRRATVAFPAAQEAIFAVDEAAQRINWRGQNLPLTPVEFRLLRGLLRRPGVVFGRAQLLDLLHDDLRDISDRVIDTHIKNIRRKIAAVDEAASYIVSVYGTGYRFEVESKKGLLFCKKEAKNFCKLAFVAQFRHAS